MALVILFCTLFTVFSDAGKELRTRVLLDGEIVGTVEEPSVMDGALRRIKKDLSGKNAGQITFRVSYAFVPDGGEEILDADDCYALLRNYLAANYTDACALQVEGRTVACLKDEETARTLVSRLKEECADLLPEDTTLTLFEAPGYEKVYVRKETVTGPERAYGDLYDRCRAAIGILPGADEPDEPTAEERDDCRTAYSYDSIYYYGSAYGADLLKNVSRLTDGDDEVGHRMASEPEPFIETTTETTTELIPYTTENVETEDLYVGQTEIASEGAAGITEITYEITTVDGRELSRTEIGRQILSEPVPCTVLVGIRPYPSTVPTGKWVMPLQSYNYVSSPFGYRSDPFTGETRYHSGMDFAAYADTPIYAVDGGTVIRAGWDSSYGLHAIIEHGPGLRVIYAHMNRISPELYEGGKVYQGQQIGAVGMTGRATGFHLHFEVQLNGAAVQPLDYLPSF